MAKVRAATPVDIPALVALGLQMHGEGRYRDVPFEPGRVAEALGAAMRLGIVLVAERQGEIVGGVALIVTPYFFSSQLVASDLALFVSTGARGGPAAIKLVQTATDAAMRMGCREVVFSSSVGVNPERFGKFMTHLGFTQRGGVYSMGA